MTDGRSSGAGRLARPIHVVMVVIGIVAVAAVIFAFPDRHGALVDESTIFANRVRAARDAAVVDGRPVRLWLAPTGYGFEERSGERWSPMTEEGLRARRWRPDMVVSIPDASGRAAVVFDRAGSADRNLTVSFAHRRDVLRVAIDVRGKISAVG